ncbi:hypothetical protein [Nocardioides alcanivorans]|uniref:hypothetical protein n=1 Tax=Nocardioides alcanivorans TaxID=2897352 RepID=UPI001F3950F5|nr:hypothetical protein [Nocardioides alcanivorans]
MPEFGPGRPLVFSHIPKTAGTSLRAALTEALGPQQVVDALDLSLVGGYDNVDGTGEQVQAMFHLTPDTLPADADLVLGHLAPGTTLARYPEGRFLTLLRDPRLRLLSQWIHSRSLSDFDLRHYRREGTAFRIARLPLLDYLDHANVAPNVDNTITRFLTWPHPLLRQDAFIDPEHDAELLAAARATIDRFDHIGLVEDPTAMTRLAQWLGVELPVVRENERTSVPKRRRTDLERELDAATLARLDHRTRLDRQLWWYVAERLLDDPQRVWDEGWARAIARYEKAMAQPVTGRPVRRAVASVYDAAYQLLRRGG